MTVRRFVSFVLPALIITTQVSCNFDPPPKQSWEVATKGIYAAAIGENGKMAAVGSVHHGGSLWQLGESMERLYNWNHKQGEYTQIVAIAFSPQSNYALTSSPQTIVLWNAKDGKPLTYWTTPGNVLDVDLGPDGNLALLGLTDHSAVIFDVKRGGVKSTFYHTNRVRSVSLSTDGSLALTGSEDQTAAVWNVKTGKKHQQVNHDNDVQLVALSPDGSTAYSVSKYDKAILWNTQDGAIIGEIPLRQSAIEKGQTFTAAAFSNDATQLLTGGTDRAIKLWNVSDQTLVASWVIPKRNAWKPTSASIITVAFGNTPGEYFAVSSNGFVHQLTLP